MEEKALLCDRKRLRNWSTKRDYFSNHAAAVVAAFVIDAKRQTNPK